METLLHIYYFTTAILSFIFSLFILITQRLIKINKLFFYLGSYFFLLSLIALTHAFLLIDLTDNVGGELMKLERIFGLVAGYFMIFLVRFVRKDILDGKTFITAVSVITVLLATALIDLIFGAGIYFLDAPPKVHVTPLSRFVFIPFSILGLGVLCLLLFRAYKATTGKNRRLIGTLFYGMLVLLPFEYWDFINLMLRKDPYNAPLYLYNMGMFLFFLFIFVFIIQFISLQIRYAMPEKAAVKRPFGCDEDYLKDVFDAFTRKMVEQELYRDAEFTMESAALAIRASRNDVSKAVNMFFHDNFSVYVNKFRVDDMIRKLKDPDPGLSILEIGIMAGFNSKTSMNRMFYKFTGKTPRQFRKMFLVSPVSIDESAYEIV